MTVSCSVTPGTVWLRAFASPRSAVDAAIAAQRELRVAGADGDRHRRGRVAGRGLLRYGVQPGCSGDGRRARRQILVADSTACLLSGVELLDLGRAAVARRRESDHGVSSAAPGLRDGVSRPCRRSMRRRGTCGPPAHQLHRPRGRGRRDRSRRCASRRLVTLTGVGGVGKTRLALQVAAQLAAEFPDGVWVFELAPVTDPAAVPDAVASVLGIIQQAGMTRGRVYRQRFGRTASDSWCSTIVNMSWTPSADLIDAILTRSTSVEDPGHQS